MIKVPVVIREDYTMLLELHDNFIWFHTDVRKWTPVVKKEYLVDLHSLQSLGNKYLVALIHKANAKLKKFAISIGFKFEKPLIGKDGQMYHIYSRSL